MLAATDKMAGVVSNGAAARYLDVVSMVQQAVGLMTYADTPMFSKIDAVATISFAVVRPNLYSQGATGLIPAPAMAPSRVET